MALVPRSADASVDTVHSRYAARTPNVNDLIAGQALDPAAPCEVRSDGKVYMCNGGSSATAKIFGFTPQNVASGGPVSLYGEGAVFYYNDGSLTAGAKYYMAATAGRLDTAATTGDAKGVAKALTTKLLVVTRAYDTI